MDHKDFVKHLERFKSDVLALIQTPKTLAKKVEERVEILSDDTIVKNIPWYSLKHTVRSPDFDLEEFTVSFDISD